MKNYLVIRKNADGTVEDMVLNATCLHKAATNSYNVCPAEGWMTDNGWQWYNEAGDLVTVAEV